MINLDLSNVTPEQFQALIPELPEDKINSMVLEIEAITQSNLSNAAKWKSYLAVLHTVLVIATKTA